MIPIEDGSKSAAEETGKSAVEGENNFEAEDATAFAADDVSTSSLAKVNAGLPVRPEKPLTIGQLELELLARFPRENAEAWDRMGLLVGDPAALVEGVAVALDPTGEAIQAASRAGANVLLTHHPAFLDAPQAFSPSHSVATVPGVNVYNAIANGVALMNFHTALDVSKEAAGVLPNMLGLAAGDALEPLEGKPGLGYGRICTVRATDAPFKLAHLAARCTSVFGRTPRVWGDFAQVLERVAVFNGSGRSAVGPALEAGADCLVCGELGYHVALDAWQAGLAVVELGHDVSELPLAAVLAQAAIDAGLPASCVSVVDQSKNWACPDSTRL
jgi:dinuclear metal center YbgI/SA1388 family protein